MSIRLARLTIFASLLFSLASFPARPQTTLTFEPRPTVRGLFQDANGSVTVKPILQAFKGVTLPSVGTNLDGVGVSEELGIPKLQCIQEATVSDVALKCTMKNDSTNHLLLLIAPVALQGAMRNQSTYFHVPSGGDRKENVLEYVPRDKSWPGILGHPFQYIKVSELQSLILVPSGSLAHIKINWPAGEKVARSFGGLRARVKLIFLRLDGREVSWRNSIQSVCGVSPPLVAALRKSKWIDLSTVRHSDFERVQEDRCGEAISTPFEDTFSEDFLIR